MINKYNIYVNDVEYNLYMCVYVTNTQEWYEVHRIERRQYCDAAAI